MDWIGWIGWILLRSLVQLEHLAVLITLFLFSLHQRIWVIRGDPPRGEWGGGGEVWDAQPGAPHHSGEEGGDREIFDQHNRGGGGRGGGQPRPMIMQQCNIQIQSESQKMLNFRFICLSNSAQSRHHTMHWLALIDHPSSIKAEDLKPATDENQSIRL